MKFESSRHISKNTQNIKFHENPSSGSRVVPCGRTDGQTEVRKLIISFYNFAKSPKNSGVKNFRLCKCTTLHLAVGVADRSDWIL